MRLDLFLKTSRLVKRRSIAREMCDSGRVLVNEREAKPAKELKQGDSITLKFTRRSITLEVLKVPAGKGRPSDDLYRVTSEAAIQQEDIVWNKDPS